MGDVKGDIEIQYEGKEDSTKIRWRSIKALKMDHTLEELEEDKGTKLLFVDSVDHKKQEWKEDSENLHLVSIKKKKKKRKLGSSEQQT